MPSADKPLLTLPDPEEDLDVDDDEIEEDIEKHLDLPPSWCNMITLTHKGMESRDLWFLWTLSVSPSNCNCIETE